MKPEERDTLEGYVRHAEHFGAEEVFETALDDGLGLRDLGFLSLRLQNLDTKWRLIPEAQRWFAVALVARGVAITDAARMARADRRTVQGWCIDPDIAEEAPELALRRASKRRFEDLKGITRGWHRTA